MHNNDTNYYDLYPHIKEKEHFMNIVKHCLPGILALYTPGRLGVICGEEAHAVGKSTNQIIATENSV